jgi:magnesium transporter
MAEVRLQTSNDGIFKGDDFTLDSIFDIVRTGGLTWVDILRPDEEVRAFLSDSVNVDELVIEDIFGDASTTIQRFDDHRFITLQVRDSDNRLDTEPVAIILKDSLLITIRSTRIPAIEVFSKRMKKADAEDLELGIDFLLYELLDSIADDWTPRLSSYSDELDRLEFQVFDPSETYDNLLEGLHSLTRQLREAYKSIESLHSILIWMLKPGEHLISKETERYFLDTQQLVTTLVKRCNNYSVGATSTRDTYLSHVSLRLAESNARLSEVMTTLTIVGAIMLPLTLIAGIFGMNNEDLPEDAIGGFWGIIGLMSAFAFVMMIYFWWRGWLSVLKRQ